MGVYAYLHIFISIADMELGVRIKITKEECELVESANSAKTLEEKILDQWDQDYYDNVRGGFITHEEHDEPLEILWNTFSIE